jgi:mitogen-activated protein kinase 7
MYTKAIDVWSAGCILAELIGRTTLFKGKDYLDQFLAIVAIMGKPRAEDFEDSDVSENLNKLSKHLP